MSAIYGMDELDRVREHQAATARKIGELAEPLLKVLQKAERTKADYEIVNANPDRIEALCRQFIAYRERERRLVIRVNTERQ